MDPSDPSDRGDRTAADHPRQGAAIRAARRGLVRLRAGEIGVPVEQDGNRDAMANPRALGGFIAAARSRRDDRLD